MINIQMTNLSSTFTLFSASIAFNVAMPQQEPSSVLLGNSQVMFCSYSGSTGLTTSALTVGNSCTSDQGRDPESQNLKVCLLTAVETSSSLNPLRLLENSSQVRLSGMNAEASKFQT
jgi:ABC-type transport system involved in multi-copper enzyme maturation permease subunit